MLFDYDATQPDELTIKVGDIISEVKKLPGGWDAMPGMRTRLRSSWLRSSIDLLCPRERFSSEFKRSPGAIRDVLWKYSRA